MSDVVTKGFPKEGVDYEPFKCYEIFYSVDNEGVVTKVKQPRKKQKLIDSHGVASGPVKSKMDLRWWYKLREFGGTVEWVERLNEIIGELEAYSA